MQTLSKRPPKPLNQLKNIHNEHYARLQNKHASETELLDDLRLFCKQRSIIERDYGQALQKLVNNFLSRKELSSVLSNEEDNSDGKSVWRVWRKLLDESNNLALARLRASDSQHRLYSELKPLKLQRIAANKRVFEQLRILQGDLAACVQEMAKSHKVYAEEEKQAQETRYKAMAAEEKIRRRSTNLFHSMAQLHRNYEKLVGRRQAYDARSATARNEYLFQLAAINAHLKHYFTKDVPSLVKALDGEFYEKLSEAFCAIGQNESEVCALTRDRFQKILKDASQISRAYAWDNFLKSCPLFDKTVQYQFEPMEGDETTLLRSPDSKEANLEQIARKLARRLVLRERRIKSYEHELKTLQSGCVAGSSSSQPHSNGPEFGNNEELLAFNQEYVEHKVEELQFAIRREEIERVKVEACLSLLKNSAVEVQQYITEAKAAAEAAAAAALAQQLRENNPSANLLDDPLSMPRSANRPSGEGSSDSVASSGGMISETRTSRISYDQSLEPRPAGDFARNSYGFQQRHSPDSNNRDFNYGAENYTDNVHKWSATTPRPTTIGQVSNQRETTNRYQNQYSSSGDEDTTVKSATWNSLRAARITNHDYQNVDPSRGPERQRGGVGTGTGTVEHSRSTDQLGSNHRVRRASLDESLHPQEELDLESVWSERGRLRQASVLHEFRAKHPEEVDLVVHETVVLLEDSDKNGWIKVRSLIDGNEGLVPLSFLQLHEEPTIKQALGTNSDENFCGPQLVVTSKRSLGNGKKTQQTGGTSQPPAYSHESSNLSTPEKLVQKRTKTRRPSACLPPPTEEPPKLPEIKVPTTDSAVSSSSGEKSPRFSPTAGTFVRTLIEFEGANTDELSFSAGSIIRVLGRAPVPQSQGESSNTFSAPTGTEPPNQLSTSGCSGVDDGWWEGELFVLSRTAQSNNPVYSWNKGVFPSMLVQTLSPDESKPWLDIWQRAVSAKAGRLPADNGSASLGSSTKTTSTPSTSRAAERPSKILKIGTNERRNSEQRMADVGCRDSKRIGDGDYIQLTANGRSSGDRATNSSEHSVRHVLQQPGLSSGALLEINLHSPSEEEFKIAEL
ncbi:unnamed protein product [Calicophoron daubneyi]|uniref:Uncharacterized protein n=1 Tax=Calicophoron daubneyi TaxID=300641 RepID=A0AAV2T5D3_CALDB